MAATCILPPTEPSLEFPLALRAAARDLTWASGRTELSGHVGIAWCCQSGADDSASRTVEVVSLSIPLPSASACAVGLSCWQSAARWRMVVYHLEEQEDQERVRLGVGEHRPRFCGSGRCGDLAAVRRAAHRAEGARSPRASVAAGVCSQDVIFRRAVTCRHATRRPRRSELRAPCPTT